ncbi:adenylosuccinate synthetase [Pseudomonas chlororaphis]|uniref:adenylosuccinate synthetase n=1 Tax=Pseudomonas chlororaphis TaxID=587753 RepID=UPI002155AE85|nr:adenylosuccinate synthetase [Pseudomonas chlororaphis]
MSWLKALANHGQLLLWAPAAPPLLAQKLPTLIVAVSHKHNRLPIPYRKGETVSCLSWGSFSLAEAGISPSRVRKILMVIRPMPIRVGDPDGDTGETSGPLKHPTTFADIAQEAGLDAEILNKAEKTSTTKRNRRVGWFDWDQFRRACALNAPTDVVLTFADYLIAANRNARRFEQLHPDTIQFIEEIERVSQAPVSLINTRFARDNDGSNVVVN